MGARRRGSFVCGLAVGLVVLPGPAMRSATADESGGTVPIRPAEPLPSAVAEAPPTSAPPTPARPAAAKSEAARLLDELADLQAKRAELDRAEQVIKAKLKEALRKQRQTIEELERKAQAAGVAVQDPPPARVALPTPTDAPTPALAPPASPPPAAGAPPPPLPPTGPAAPADGPAKGSEKR